MKQMSLIKKWNIDFRFIVSFIAVWTLLLMFLPQNLAINNIIYAIDEKTAYDANLFCGNVYMGTGIISPRYIVNIIFGILMKLNGGDWAGAALLWIYFGAGIQALGIANIARRIHSKYQNMIAAILVCLIAYCNAYLAGFYLIELQSIGMGSGIAFSFLSISFLIGERRDYGKAWIFAACASICHIHEGIYCCMIIFLFAVVDSFIQHKVLWKENKVMMITVAALLFIALPSFYTDSMNISDTEFVSIYSTFRHPHHLVPSMYAGGVKSIYKTLWFNVFLFLLFLAANIKTKSEQIKSEQTKFYMIEAFCLVIVWIAALLVMYTFTEVKPIALISTLFLSKSFKYVLLIAFIWIIKAVFDLREHGNYITSYLYLFFAFFAADYELHQIGFMAMIIYIVMQVEDYFVKNKECLFSSQILPVMDVLYFVFVICAKQEILGINIGFLLEWILAFKSAVARAMSSGLEQGTTVVLVFLAITAIGFMMKYKMKGWRVFCSGICFCMIGLSLAGRIVLYDSGDISLINGEKALIASMGNDLYDLAEEFRSKTNVTTEFLADPDDALNSGWFQVVSERNCYVVHKVIPSSKATVDEWYKRYLQTTSFLEKTDIEIKEIMDSSAIKYVLVTTDNYAKLDESQDFSVFMCSKEDLFRIYQKN